MEIATFNTSHVAAPKKRIAGIFICGIFIPRDVIDYLLQNLIPEELLLWRRICHSLKEMVEETFKEEKFCLYSGFAVKDSMNEKIFSMKKMKNALVTGASPRIREIKTAFLSSYKPGRAPVASKIGDTPVKELELNPESKFMEYKRLEYKNHCESDANGKETNFFNDEIDYNVRLDFKSNTSLVITSYDRQNFILQNFTISEIEIFEDVSYYSSSVAFDIAYEYDEYILIQHPTVDGIPTRRISIADKKELLTNKTSIGRTFTVPRGCTDYLCLGNTFYFCKSEMIYSQSIEITKKRNHTSSKELICKDSLDSFISLDSKIAKNPNSPAIFVKIFGSYYIILSSTTKCHIEIFTLQGKLEFTLELSNQVKSTFAFPLISTDYLLFNNIDFVLYFDRIGWEKKEYIQLKNETQIPCGGLVYYQKIGILGFDRIEGSLSLSHAVYLFGKICEKFCVRKAKEITMAKEGYSMFGNDIFCGDGVPGRGGIIDYSSY